MGAFYSKNHNTTTAVSKKKPPEVNDIDRTVLDLKNARDRLQKYRKKLEYDKEQLLERAKVAKLAGNQTTALNLLKLRKYKQIQYDNCEEQLLNILKLVETIDSKRNDTQVLDAMKAGKDTLKRLHEETTVDDVIQLFDEINEQHDIEQEINTIIMQNVPTTGIDESELEQELLDMMSPPTAQQEQQQQPTPSLPVVPDTPLLPQVPATTLPEPSVPISNREEPVAIPS